MEAGTYDAWAKGMSADMDEDADSLGLDASPVWMGSVDPEAMSVEQAQECWAWLEEAEPGFASVVKDLWVAYRDEDDDMLAFVSKDLEDLELTMFPEYPELSDEDKSKLSEALSEAAQGMDSDSDEDEQILAKVKAIVAIRYQEGAESEDEDEDDSEEDLEDLEDMEDGDDLA